VSVEVDLEPDWREKCGSRRRDGGKEGEKQKVTAEKRGEGEVEGEREGGGGRRRGAEKVTVN
jgi:hypothetical protein